MPFIKTVLILSFLFGFIFHYYYEIKILKEKDRTQAIFGSFANGLLFIFFSFVFYFMNTDKEPTHLQKKNLILSNYMIQQNLRILIVYKLPLRIQLQIIKFTQ